MNWAIAADGGITGIAFMLGASGLVLELAILVFVATRIDKWTRRNEAKKVAARKAAELPLDAIATLLREIEAGNVEVTHAEHDSTAAGGEVAIAFKFRLKQLKFNSSKQWFGESEGGKKESAAHHPTSPKPSMPMAVRVH